MQLCPLVLHVPHDLPARPPVLSRDVQSFSSAATWVDMSDGNSSSREAPTSCGYGSIL